VRVDAAVNAGNALCAAAELAADRQTALHLLDAAGEAYTAGALWMVQDLGLWLGHQPFLI
jgi:hypothetical protein